MADNLVDALGQLHQRIANAQVGSGSSPEAVAAMLRASQQSLLNNLRKNPTTYTKKMTGVGKK